MGRPRKEINWDLAEKAAALMCTGEEIAALQGVSYDTLERRVKELEEFDNFADWFKRHSAGAKKALRRAQFKNALEKNNATMQIWLGKQYLDQTDKNEAIVTNREIKVDVFSNENPFRKNRKTG